MAWPLQRDCPESFPGELLYFLLQSFCYLYAFSSALVKMMFRILYTQLLFLHFFFLSFFYVFLFFNFTTIFYLLLDLEKFPVNKWPRYCVSPYFAICCWCLYFPNLLVNSDMHVAGIKDILFFPRRGIFKWLFAVNHITILVYDN